MKTRALHRLIVILLWLCSSAASAQPSRFVAGIGPVDAMAFTPDGKLLLATDYLVAEYDPLTHSFVSINQFAAARTWSLVPFNDGERILSYSGDKKLRVWERQTGHVLATFEWNPPASYTRPSVPTAGIAPDDSLIAVALPDHETSGTQLMLLDPETLETVLAIEDALINLDVPPAFTPDAHHVLFVDQSEYFHDLPGSVMSLDLDSGSQATDLRLLGVGYRLSVRSISTKGNRAACALTEWTQICSYVNAGLGMGYWRHDHWWALGVVSGDDLGMQLMGNSCFNNSCSVLCEPATAPPSVLLSPHARYLAAGTSIFDLQETTTVTMARLAPSAFSRDEELVAGLLEDTSSSSMYPSIAVVRTGTGEAVSTIPGASRSQVLTAALLPSGHLVMAAGADHLIRCWDASTGSLSYSMSGGPYDAPLKLLASADDSLVFVYSPMAALLYAEGTPTPIHSFDEPSPYRGASFARGDSRFILSAGSLQQFLVDGAANPAVSFDHTYDSGILPAPTYGPVQFVSNDQIVLAATRGGLMQLHEFDSDSGDLLAAYDLSEEWLDFTANEDASRFLVKVEDGLRIYSRDDLEIPLCTLPIAEAQTLTRAGKVVLTVGSQGLSAYEFATGNEIASYPFSTPAPYSFVAASPDTDTVYTSGGTTILEWSVPLDALAEGATAPILNRLLGKEEPVPPLDRNSDSRLDAADVPRP
jgi:WD40 repeat protein